MMKKIFTCLLATLGLTSACQQKNYEEADVEAFAELIITPGVVVLDARTSEEYSEGHIEGAVNIDVKKKDFLDVAKTTLPTEGRIAVYCRGGRRSAKACSLLSAEGYRCINLKGGFTAWKTAGKPSSAR